VPSVATLENDNWRPASVSDPHVRASYDAVDVAVSAVDDFTRPTPSSREIGLRAGRMGASSSHTYGIRSAGAWRRCRPDAELAREALGSSAEPMPLPPTVALYT